MHDSRIRALRLVEEAIELAQALDVPREQLARLIGVVYERPRGDPDQEIGGLMVCLGVLCMALGRDLDELFEREVLRVLSKTPEHFAERNKHKLDLGLTGHD